MGFFLGIIYCCGSATLPSADPMGSTKPLVPQQSRNLRQKRRGASDWRPSLGSISENGMTATQRERGAVASQRDAKRRSGGGAAASAPTAKLRQRNYSDNYDYDHGRAAMPTIMPAFSPTPFMF